jgi:hypothetical protein
VDEHLFLAAVEPSGVVCVALCCSIIDAVMPFVDFYCLLFVGLLSFRFRAFSPNSSLSSNLTVTTTLTMIFIFCA